MVIYFNFVFFRLEGSTTTLFGSIILAGSFCCLSGYNSWGCGKAARFRGGWGGGVGLCLVCFVSQTKEYFNVYVYHACFTDCMCLQWQVW